MAHPPAPGEPPPAGPRHPPPPPAAGEMPTEGGGTAPAAPARHPPAAGGRKSAGTAVPGLTPSGTRYLLAGASFVIVVAGLRAAKAIFIPALLALFLAVLSLPLLFWLRRHRVPRWLAVLLTVLAVLVILTVAGLVMGESLDQVDEVVPIYLERLYQQTRPLAARLQAAGIDVSDWFTAELLSLDRILEVTANTFAGVATALSLSVLVPLILIFALLEAMGFRGKLAWALGRDTSVVERFAKINREVQHYLVIKTAVSLATGVAVGLLLWLLGLDFPLFWGFLAFLFNYVPNIGSVVAAVPPVLLGLVQLGLTRTLLIALVFVLVNLLLGNILEPNLMGRRLRLSPLVVLLSLVFWGWVWGPVGMLLAVPLTMVGKIMLENTERYAWVAKLLDHPKSAREGTGPPPPAATAATPAEAAPGGSSPGS